MIREKEGEEEAYKRVERKERRERGTERRKREGRQGRKMRGKEERNSLWVARCLSLSLLDMSFDDAPPLQASNSIEIIVARKKVG